jgi:hypothetical protein
VLSAAWQQRFERYNFTRVLVRAVSCDAVWSPGELLAAVSVSKQWFVLRLSRLCMLLVLLLHLLLPTSSTPSHTLHDTLRDTLCDRLCDTLCDTP